MGIVMMVRRNAIRELMTAIIEQRALIFILAMLRVLIGLAIVLAHNQWRGTLAIVVTLIGWITLLRGIALMLLPADAERKVLTIFERSGPISRGGDHRDLVRLAVELRGLRRLSRRGPPPTSHLRETIVQNDVEHMEPSERIRALPTRTLPDRHFRDWTYGATRGAVITFAIVAGAVGADLPATVILVVGLASLIANGFALAARNFIAAKEHYVLPTESALEVARLTFTACMVSGLIPLVAYPAGLTICTLAAASSFFVIGVMKSRSLRIEWWRSGLDSLLIGLSAAALAFAAGHTLRPMIPAH